MINKELVETMTSILKRAYSPEPIDIDLKDSLFLKEENLSETARLYSFITTGKVKRFPSKHRRKEHYKSLKGK
jgi:hypothetical protein